jgi:Leucine-rich repeat (LRR) protein
MTGGRYWNKTHDNWLKPGVPICSREGVSCGNSGEDENVDEVILDDFGLRGSIPSEIWELSNARQLRFSNNAVSVSFEGIENAKNLMVLQMSRCHLRNLDGLRNAPITLKEINFSWNQFEGSIPSDIFELTHAQKLYLNNNHFSGRLPSDIARIQNLDELWIGNNMFTGAMPSEIGFMTNLKTLSVKQNDLSGEIPLEIQNLALLEVLDLSGQNGNQFVGPLPAFDRNPNLKSMDASGNAFSGMLPEAFLNQVDTAEQIKVNLSSNAFVGGIPEQWARFESLEIDLSENQLTSMSAALCEQNGWNGGRVGLLGTCDAILCPPGTHLTGLGRQIDPLNSCEPCEGGEKAAPFLAFTIVLIRSWFLKGIF